jgi:hypothetical protein
MQPETPDPGDGVAAGSDRPEAETGARHPGAAAISFVTTEHFTLQGARSQTISESTGRANMFLAAVSGGLVALGLVATATHVGTAFYVFGLILLPTLAFVGLVTFERVLQNRIENRNYAQQIARLRAYYFANAPELTPYLLSVRAGHRLAIQGLPTTWRFQRFVTVAAMTAVIVSVLAGSALGLLVAVLLDHELAAPLILGSVFAAGVMTVLMRYQHAAWRRDADQWAAEAQ